MTMEKLIKEFTAKLKAKQVEYDNLLAKAKACLGNRIAKCTCTCENLCLNCIQDRKLFDEIEKKKR